MMIDDRLVERIARAVHERYLNEQQRNGAAMGSSPAMTAWSDLDEDKRDANRAQVRAIGAKLQKVGCAVVPGTRDGRMFAFTDQELEALARDEQARWVEQRRSAGWVYGAVRDDRTKRHPSLVSWDELKESERDKDRDAVRGIPAVLATAGLQVRRVRRHPTT